MEFLDRITLTYFFVAVAAFVVTQALFNFIARPIVGRMELNRRMKMIMVENSRERVFAELMKARGLTATGSYRYPLVRGFNTLVVQSGLTIGVEVILLIMLLLSGLGTALFMLRYNFGSFLAVPLGVVIGVGGMLLFLMWRRRKRQALFAVQLPDALELIARSLKAGHPLPVALTLAAREIADPLGSEFGIFSDELAYGLPMSKALRNLQVRVGQEDLGVLATGIIIQNEVGGNLIELVSSLSNLLRERVKMRRKVRVLTSEGRMSGAMLSALPIFIFLALNLVSPKFYGEVWDKPIVTVFLVGGFIWMLLGNFVIYRMVNFKY
jgi:tight adherence protein B